MIKINNENRTNLWNVDYKKGTNTHKTRDVIMYIECLKEPACEPGSNSKILKKFNKIKHNALSKTSPDDMLRTIGYRPNSFDLIYEWCSLKKGE